jgi:hypothetical protein
MNTIGMLLAHIAYAETHIVQVGVLGETTGHAHDVIGLTEAEEGLPLAPNAPPSGRSPARISPTSTTCSIARGATLTIAARDLGDADLERRIVRPPRPTARAGC